MVSFLLYAGIKLLLRFLRRPASTLIRVLRRFLPTIQGDNTFYDFYTDSDYYKYTQVYGEPMTELSAAKFEASLSICPTEQERNSMLNTPRGKAFTRLNYLKANSIGQIPIFSPLNNQSSTPTHIDSKGVSFQKDRSIVSRTFYNPFTRSISAVSQYELMRCFHFVTAKHKTFISFNDALEQYRGIRPDVPPTNMKDLLILAMKLYCEVYETELNFASGPTFSKSALERAGVSVPDF